jgi:hypothetical protein
MKLQLAVRVIAALAVAVNLIAVMQSLTLTALGAFLTACAALMNHFR